MFWGKGSVAGLAKGVGARARALSTRFFDDVFADLHLVRGYVALGVMWRAGEVLFNPCDHNFVANLRLDLTTYNLQRIIMRRIHGDDNVVRTASDNIGAYHHPVIAALIAERCEYLLSHIMRFVSLDQHSGPYTFVNRSRFHRCCLLILLIAC